MAKTFMKAGYRHANTGLFPFLKMCICGCLVCVRVMGCVCVGACAVVRLSAHALGV